MNRTAKNSRIRQINLSAAEIRMIILFAFAYFLLAKISLYLSLNPNYSASFWLPSGLFVSVLLLNEKKLWSHLIITGIIANIIFDLLNAQLLVITVFFSFGNAMEALIGAFLITKFIKKKFALHSLKDLYALIFFSALISPVVSALIGSLTILFNFENVSFIKTFITFWSGNFIGILTFAPLVLCFEDIKTKLQKTNLNEIIEIILTYSIFIMLFVITYLFDLTKYFEKELLIFPALLFIAFRRKINGVAFSSIILVILTVLGTSNQMWYFGANLGPVEEQSLGMHLYLGITITLFLVVGVILKEREIAELTIRKSELKFRQLSENIRQVFWLRSKNELIYISPEYENIWGRTCQSLYDNPNTFLDSVYAEDYDKVVNLFLKVFQDTTSFNEEYRIVKPNGEIRWVNVKMHLFIDEVDSTLKSAGIAEDITDRKQNEGALLKSEEQFRMVWNKSLDGMRIMDENGKILLVNDAFCKTVQLSKQQLEGAHLSILFHNSIAEISDSEEQRSKMELYRQRFRSNTIESMFERELYLWNGNKIWVEVTNSYMEIDKGGLVLLSIFRDITERKNYIKELDRERNLLLTLIKNLPHSIYVKDKEGKKILTNPTDLKFIGKSEEEVIGKTDLEVFPNEISSKCFSDDMSVINTGKPILNEEELIENVDGKNYWLLTSKLPLKDSEEKVYGLIGVGQDITERKILDDKLKKYYADLKEANATKDKFISIISHDLRSPIQGILGITELFESEIESFSREEIKNISRELNKAVKGQFDLLEDILTWSRIQSNRIETKLESLTIKEELSRILSLLTPSALNKGIQLIDQIPEEEIIYADRNMLQLLLRNLISNAIKFSFKGSKIIIGYNSNESTQEIFVKDFGVGIDEDDFKKIFMIDSHYTTKGTADEKGTGLGLVLCNEIIGKHFGKIFFESKKNEGTTFHVIFPK